MCATILTLASFAQVDISNERSVLDYLGKQQYSNSKMGLKLTYNYISSYNTYGIILSNTSGSKQYFINVGVTPYIRSGYANATGMNTQGKNLTIKITSGGEVSVAGTVFSSSPSAKRAKTTNVKIGDYYEGGIVFYLDGSGGGLIVSLDEEWPNSCWSCSDKEVRGADGILIGTGLNNTKDIVRSCSEKDHPANACYGLNSGGFSDWFLPSINALQELYNNKEIVMQSIIAHKGVPLGSVDHGFGYWSSTEKDSHQMWYFDFRDHAEEPRKAWLSKSSQVGVRAIRSF